jgi:hypothetical protein
VTDVHIDIGHVEHGEDFAARRQHLVDISDAILEAAVAGRHERVVSDVHLVELDIMLGGVERELRFAHLGDGRG